MGLVFFLCAPALEAEEGPQATHKLAAESGFGMALAVGEPSALSAKLWISEASAINASFGWSFYRRTPEGMRKRGAPHAYIDYLYHFFDRVKARTGKFVYFMGVGVEGAYMDYNDRFHEKIFMGMRFPFGLSYMFPNAPVDVFLELGPSIVVMRGMSFDMSACLGIRYWLF